MSLWNNLNRVSDIHINEAFNLPSADAIANNVKSVDFLPNNLDISIPSWLKRLEYWGNIKITHTSPEFKVKNKSVNKSVFIKNISQPNLLNALGKWTPKEGKNFNNIIIDREYRGLDGKKYKEEYELIIDFYPEIKNKLKKY